MVDTPQFEIPQPVRDMAEKNVEQARAANPRLLIIARAHSDAEAAHLEALGASAVVQGAEEIAHALVERFQRSAQQAG